MRVVILYRPNSEHSGLVDNFIHDWQSRHTDRIEIMNIDSREGAATASLYDVMQYPAIMVLQNDGSPQQVWQGETLPLMDEVYAYAHA